MNSLDESIQNAGIWYELIDGYLAEIIHTFCKMKTSLSS